MDIFEWIERELAPRACTSGELIYEDVESQSGRSLPIIYQPFDAADPAHWRDRGSLFDYLEATSCAGRRVLDFGPGDGWPSLILAPFVAEVVGVEGSARRAAVCTANARRLGIANASFVHVPPPGRLPFPDRSFDAATAASSIEQTPDPKAALREICRVLRPGGRLRLSFESLDAYRGGRERDVWLARLDDRSSRLILFDRRVDEELAWNYGLTLAMSCEAVRAFFASRGAALTFESATPERLAELRPSIVDARVCRLHHPSGATLARWLREVGFGDVRLSHSGAAFAGRLFAQLPEDQRPRDLPSVDALLRPIVRVVIGLAAPSSDAMITAVK